MGLKKILGLDLGTTSIGWAIVHENKEHREQNAIIKLGVRVNPLTTDEQANFEEGKSITTNAGRRTARSMRRNLQRYKLRRTELIEILKKHNIITENTPLTESGPDTTFQTQKLRMLAAKQRIELEELARVLLLINKKRGYKSNRKLNQAEDGQPIDSMDITKKLYERKLTPGQYVYEQLQKGKNIIPDFYRSDLENELQKIWTFQKTIYPNILTEELKKAIKDKGKRKTSEIFFAKYGFNTADNKGNWDKKRLTAYKWRDRALREALPKEELAYVIADVNGKISTSSGLLGAISDRSKELYFNKQTIGAYLWQQLENNPYTRLKNQIFYRQDYLDEFEKIWKIQARHHKILTEELKKEIRDIVIFYQRKLKSKKGLINFCEFEQKEIKTPENKTKTAGARVASKSSPLAQEFKIWQQLHNVRLKHKESRETRNLNPEEKNLLFEELNIKGALPADSILKLLELHPNEWETQYKQLDGNTTNQALYNAYLNILEYEGYDIKNKLKAESDKEKISVSDLKASAAAIKQMVADIFTHLGIHTAILTFDAQLKGKAFEQQAAYQLWHWLYSYTEDDSRTGMEHLYEQLQKKFGFSRTHAQLMGSIVFKNDYGNLSIKAMRKIYPFILEQQYSDACVSAGYRHSKDSLTWEELAHKNLKKRLDLVPKNSLRNPVVEKILNQMIHVVNGLIDEENKKLESEGKESDFHFDEIRIELARELKQSAEERENLTKAMKKNEKERTAIVKILQEQDHIPNPSRNDIIRYRLYQELKSNGYKDLYTNEYIPREKLFSKDYEIEHIIPKSRVFDNSFSNLTLSPSAVNKEKKDQTAYDYILNKYGEKAVKEYEQRVKDVYPLKKITSNKSQKTIVPKKRENLLKKQADINNGFIARDLGETRYISKKAKEMLSALTQSPIVVTSGKITETLRKDWGLMNILKELNIGKYRTAGLTENRVTRDGKVQEFIEDWTKRNDQRHHAVDALTVAFTTRSHIQYINFFNARKDTQHKEHHKIIYIEKNITQVIENENGKRWREYIVPISNLRYKTKKHLEELLISYKTKNKVVTKNQNKIAGKEQPQKTLTPRGQLHKETIYGCIKSPVSKEVKVSDKFDEAQIAKVAHPKYRSLLTERLQQNDNNPKKAFGGKNSLNKRPIYLDAEQTKVLPEKVKLLWYEEEYTIRKEITPDLQIDKVIDEGVKRLLQKRLEAFGGDAKKAFSDLEKDPIWLNKEKGIAIKRVRISGVKNASALHYKKDHFGKTLLDAKNTKIPVDFISTGNNHHVAIYEDKKGDLQEQIVSFFEAVERAYNGLPVVDKTFNNNEDLGWKFLFTMKQNEMFVFPSEDFDPHNIDLLDRSNYKQISKHLYRIQKISTKNYYFRHHLETTVKDIEKLRGQTYIRITNLARLRSIIKVRINHLGEIIQIGEY